MELLILYAHVQFYKHRASDYCLRSKTGIEVTTNLYLGLHITNKYTKVKKSKRVNHLSDRLKSFGLIHIRTPSHDESATESLKVGRVVNSNHFIVNKNYQHLRFAVVTITIVTRVRLSATLKSCYNYH